MNDHEPVLKKEMDQLHQWFDRLYGKTRGGKLKIYVKWNRDKKREEYIIDLFFDSTSCSLPFSIPEPFMTNIDWRVSLKQRWVGEMQTKIAEVLG
jgi:hypothetical protein